MTPQEIQEAIDRFCDLENRVQELERQISTSTEDRTMSDVKEPTGWRDIQSAPKHTAVDLLGYYPGRNPKPRRIPDCKLSSSKRWSTKHRDPSGRSLLRANFTPTHWMPLPPPPGQDTSELEALQARCDELEAAALNVLAHLVAAVSVIKTSEETGDYPSCAYGSDTMYQMAMKDFHKSMDVVRKALRPVVDGGE